MIVDNGHTKNNKFAVKFKKMYFWDSLYSFLFNNIFN